MAGAEGPMALSSMLAVDTRRGDWQAMSKMQEQAEVGGLWKFFRSLGQYTIKGRGLMFEVENDRERTGREGFKDLIGEEVVIDGKFWRVKGVERHCINGWPKGWKIGLWVEELDGPTEAV